MTRKIGKSRTSKKTAESLSRRDFAAQWIPLAIGIAAFAAFFPALKNEFVDWDDDVTLVHNPYYRGLGWNELRWMFTTFHTGHYQPLSWVTFAVDYLIWGTDPFGYHLTNLVLHTANAILFYLLTMRLLALVFTPAVVEKKWPLGLAAAVSSLIFAVHPLRVESVVWATERRDVLSGFFFLASIYAYLRACESASNGHRRRWLAVAVIGHGLSLLAKGTAMTLPVVLLLLDVFPLRRLPGRVIEWFTPQFRYVLREKILFFLLALVFAVIALFAQHDTGALRPMQQYFLTYRMGQAFYGLWFYLWKTLVPVKLSPLYELPYDFDAWMPLFLLCGGVVIVITLALFLLRQHWPALLACWLYYVVVVSPVLGVVQSGPQLVADRYSYLSCLSWALLAGGAFYYWWNVDREPYRRFAFAAVSVAAMIALVLGTLAWKQTEIWRNTKTLWEHVILVTPHASIAHFNLGRHYEREGNLEVAVDYYRYAVNINPTMADAHYNLGRLLARQGMREEAIAHYRQVIALKPSAADAHNNLGLLLALRGEIREALTEFQKAVQVDPRHARAFFNMGRVLARQGDLDAAVHNFQEAVKLSPKEAEIHLGLGDALARQGQWQQAVIHLQDAVRLKPDLTDAHVALARSLAAQGKMVEAEKHYRQGLQLLKSQTQPAN